MLGALDVVNLTSLMDRTLGRPEVIIGLIDGPVALDHPDLSGQQIRQSSRANAACLKADSIACIHGTFIAGILSARRGSAAPAICPGCTLFVRPIFAEPTAANGAGPSATPDELATAILETIDAGARLINVSAAVVYPSVRGEGQLTQALDYAAQRGTVTVAAAGNQATMGSSTITRHPSVIPVVACDLNGKPLAESNLSRSIGRQGLSAPGDRITSLGTGGKPYTLGGTSAAAAFVSGAIALIWSEFPAAAAAEIRFAITQRGRSRPSTVVPPLLNGWAAYQRLALGL